MELTYGLVRCLRERAFDGSDNVTCTPNSLVVGGVAHEDSMNGCQQCTAPVYIEMCIEMDWFNRSGSTSQTQ